MIKKLLPLVLTFCLFSCLFYGCTETPKGPLVPTDAALKDGPSEYRFTYQEATGEESGEAFVLVSGVVDEKAADILLPAEKILEDGTSVKVLGVANGAFHYNSAIERVYISEPVETIGYQAFGLCTSLKEVTLPASLKLIETGAFDMCPSLTTITFLGTQAEWSAVTKKNGWMDEGHSYTLVCADGLSLID